MSLLALNRTLKFGDYEVDTLLGPGSVTETYRAARNGGTPVALKLLRPDRGGADPKVRAAFVAIAKRNKTLRLPGVAKVVEIHDAEDDVYCVTELLDGVNLEGLFDSATASGSMDPQLVGQMGVQIARVLTRLHERREPIIHGGLCPGNIIVTSGGRVTLVDPGVSAALRPLADIPIDRNWFVAPEISLDGEAPTVASDVYGLGAVLYYLLTGEPPVMGETIDELAEIFDEGPPTVPGLPDWLEDSLLMMLARDPHDRPRSAAAVALSLNPFPEGATRLGAIVSGNVMALPSALPEAPGDFDPMLAHGTMSVGGGQKPLAQQEGEASGFLPEAGPDELANPFDSPESSGAGAGPVLELERAAPVKPKAAAKHASPQLTLTPLRPAAVLVPPDDPPLGLNNEPRWADGAASPVSLANEPRWADGDSISIGVEPKVEAPQRSNGAAPHSPALQNEPQWADGGPSMVAAARAYPLPVDDYLDIGPASSAKSLNLDNQVGRVELPDLMDVDIASPVVSSVTNDENDRAPLGLVSFGNSNAASPVDYGQLGAIGFSEEDEEAAAAVGIGSAGGIILPQVPRRAGSARKGVAVKKRSAALTKSAVALIILGGGGFLAMKVLSKPETVLPSPEQLAKQHGPDKAAEAKPTAQNPNDVTQARGELSIITTPRGATIWIDGQEKGKTPVTVSTAPGAHRVVIVKPGFKMLREVTDTTEGLTIKRTLPPANINFGGNVVLKVDCKTAGKYPVFIDGKDTGLLCPIESLKVPSGNRLIGLYVIPDNKIWSFEREVTAGAKAHRVVFSY